MTTRTTYKVGQVIRIAGTQPDTVSLIERLGDEWLITEIDRSVLSRNFGMLIVPASYRGTDHLADEWNVDGRIHIVYGTTLWTRLEPIDVVEVVS